MSQRSKASTSSAISRNRSASTLRYSTPQMIAQAMFLGELEDVVEIDHVRLAADAVVDDRVEPAREVDLEAVREVAAMRELEQRIVSPGLSAASRRPCSSARPHVAGRSRARPRRRFRAVDRRLLDLVDDLAAAVVALAGIASAYLFVGTSPTASKTLGHVKFSEAMSSIWPRCRSGSRPRSSAISGSISVSPAVRSCSSVSCATATTRSYLARRTARRARRGGLLPPPPRRRLRGGPSAQGP